MSYAAWLLLSVLPLLAAPPPPTSGVWSWDQRTGATRFVGAVMRPTIDPANRRLYAVDAQGRIVRWSLDALDQPPAVFAVPGEGTVYDWPLAAATGGQVAAFRAFSLNDGSFRICLDILTPEGQHLRGPLPLIVTRQAWNGTHLAAWHPNGEQIAFGLTEGEPRNGLYVFEPATRNWVAAEFYSDQYAGPMPSIRFAPNGRTMSLIHNDTLYFRAGADWGAYRTIPVRGRLHAWLNDEILAVADRFEGLTLYDIGGQRVGRLDDWTTGTDDLSASLPASSPHGLAWVRPAGERQLELAVRPLNHGPTVAAMKFGGTSKGYGLIGGPPVWHPSEPVVFYWVP